MMDNTGILPDDQRDVMIRTVLGEAGNQGDTGMAAVGHVIMNRVAKGDWGDKPSDVVLAKNQFEPWGTQASAARLKAIDPQSPAYQRAGQVVDAVVGGQIPDITNGATHFYAPQAQAALGRDAPKWAGGQQGQQIGAHVFFAPEGRVSWASQQGGNAVDAVNKVAGQPDNQPAQMPASALSFALATTPPGIAKTASATSPMASMDDFEKRWGMTPEPATTPSANASVNIPKQVAPTAGSEGLVDDFGRRWGMTDAKATDNAPQGQDHDPATGRPVTKDANGIVTTYDAAGKPQQSFQPEDWQRYKNSKTSQLGSFAEGALNAIPIAGPSIVGGIQNAAAATNALRNGTTFDQEKQNAQTATAADKENYPKTNMAGSIAGGVGSFVGAGSTAIGGKLLGQTGGLASRAILGTGTNALIGGADAAARGNDILTGAGIGGAFGLAGAVIPKTVAAAAGGAALGAGGAYLTGNDPVTGALYGGAAGSLVPMGAKALSFIRAGVEPFYQGGQDAIANRILDRFGKGAPMTGNAGEFVPGSTPTLAQATGNPGLATLERGVRDVNPTPFVARAQENASARDNVMAALKGDSVSLDNLISDRATQANPLRDQALQNATHANPSPVVDKIDEILAGPAGQRDAVVKALTNIRQKLVTNQVEMPDGSKMNVLETDPKQLYGMRQAIGDMLSPLSKGTEANAQLASKQLMAVKGALDSSIEEAAPGFTKYLKTYSDASKPIDTQEFLQKLNLTDSNGKMTLAKVDSAIKGIEKARMAGGTNQAKSIPDDTLSQLYGVREDMRRESNSSLGRSLGSNTFQNLATNNLVSQFGPALTAIGGLASNNPLLALAGMGVRRAYKGADETIMNNLTSKLLSPNTVLPNPSGFSQSPVVQGWQNFNPTSFVDSGGPIANRLLDNKQQRNPAAR